MADSGQSWQQEVDGSGDGRDIPSYRTLPY